MLQALKSLIHDISQEFSGLDSGGHNLGPEDYQVAAAALLVRAGHIDGQSGEAERQMLGALLTQRFGLSESELRDLIEQAEEDDRDAVDLYRFTSVLKRKLDSDGRLRLIEMMWDMAYADGVVHEFEENLIWRVAELVGVDSHDRIALRQRVAARQTDLPG
jgi:uncharacterized tellurite resistance protein B-like protein